MIFGPNFFSKLITDPRLAEKCSILANDMIRTSGIPLTGNFFESGKCRNFSTDEERADTHVCIGIGMSEIGLYDDPSEASSIHVKSTEDSDLIDVMKQTQEMLMREVQQLRNQGVKK